MHAPAPFLFERVGRDWKSAHGALLSAWVAEAEAALPLLPPGTGDAPAQPAELHRLQILGPPGLALWALDRAARDAGWAVWTGRDPIFPAAGAGGGGLHAGAIRIAGAATGHDTPHVWAPSGDPERYPRAPLVSRHTRAAGGVLVRGRGFPLTWTEADLEAHVAALSAVFDATSREAQGRDIVVLHRDWTDPGTRRLLAWGEARGAAILFEPEPEWAFSTLVWARPTRIFAGFDEFLRWEPLLSTRSPRDWTRKRGPFGRLRTLIVDGEGGGEFVLSEAWDRILKPLQVQIQILPAS